jgi:hypothetical protein
MKKFKDFFQEIQENRIFKDHIRSNEIKSHDPLISPVNRHRHAKIAMLLNKNKINKAVELDTKIKQSTSQGTNY